MRRLLWAALLLGCNPYNPDLGDKPFLCGTDDPRCPDGYTPVNLSRTRCECQRNATAGDASVYVCDHDTNEPNDATSVATDTQVVLNMAYNSGNTSICPADDVDIYKLAVPAPGTIIKATVTFDDTTVTPPDLDILGKDATTLTPSKQSDLGHIIGTATAQTAGGPYYVLLKGTGGEVNYTVRIEILH